jgi:hypothetical protein
MKRLIVSSAVILACLAAPAVALQQGPVLAESSSQTTELPAVEVTGAARRDMIADFVQSVTASPEHMGQVAQFDGTVCPGVVNLPVAQAQAINDHIATLALSLGLKVGEPGCRANILVIAAEEADPVARELVQMAPGVFDSDSEAWRAVKRRDAFLESGQPVRWWHVSRTETGVYAGMVWSAVGANPGPGEINHGHHGTGAPVGGGYGGDISSRGAVTNITGAIVVLDTQQIGRVAISGLGDYVAMVALARLEPDAQVGGAQTVLNLFESDATRTDITSLTAWDRAYLKGVYDAKRDALHAGWQEQEIARSMNRDLSSEARASAAADQ